MGAIHHIDGIWALFYAGSPGFFKACEMILVRDFSTNLSDHLF
jgi:hypothetical protein